VEAVDTSRDLTEVMDWAGDFGRAGADVLWLVVRGGIADGRVGS
jgi:hypothetical protein